MASAIATDNLSLEDLLTLRDEVDEAIAAKRRAAAAELKAHLEMEAERLQMSVRQIVNGVAGGRRRKSRGAAGDAQSGDAT